MGGMEPQEAVCGCGGGLGKDSALGQGRGHLHLAPLEEGKKASALKFGEPVVGERRVVRSQGDYE